MSILNWLTDLFITGPHAEKTHSVDPQSTDVAEINPASGLPMVGGMGGLDIAGNPWGVDSSATSPMHDSIFNHHDGICGDSHFGGGIAGDSFSDDGLCGGGFSGSDGFSSW